MSIHTIIESNIHDFDDLIQVLESQDITWESVPVNFKGSNEQAFCGVAAWIDGETVLIYQRHSDEPFVFQSAEWFFRNKSGTEALAQNGMGMVARKRKENEKEKRRKLVEEENLRKIADKQERERLQELQQRAADVLQRLEAEKAARRQEWNKPTAPPLASQCGTSPSFVSLESAIGKFHQQNALRKILDSFETLDQDTGLTLYSQETLEDETIELTLRG